MVLGPAALARAQPWPADLDRRIASATHRLEALVERHNAVRDDLRATRARLAATSARVDRLAAGTVAARDRLGGIAALAYKAGPTGPLTALLTAESPDTAMRRLVTLDTMSRSQRREILGLVEVGRRWDAERQALRDLATAQATQAAQLSRLVRQVRRDLADLRDLRRRVGTASRATPRPPPPGASTAPPPPPSPAPPAAEPGGRAVRFAYAQIGKPYRFGAAGPWAYDCSGLTLAAWRAAGVVLPHNAARQYHSVPHVSRADLRPGDLVFYYADIHHVALYVGRGYVIHAPNAMERIRVSPLNLGPVHGFGRPG